MNIQELDFAALDPAQSQQPNVFRSKQVAFGPDTAPDHWLEAKHKAILYQLPRFLHKFWAMLFGYFWMPCDLCQRPFGGHEHCWATNGKGYCVCPDCAINGKAFTTQISIHLNTS